MTPPAVSRVVARVRRAVARVHPAVKGDREGGQISVLILGMFVLVTALLIGGIDVTAVQLARIRMLDAADAAALDASDTLDEAAAYRLGVGAVVRLSDATVQHAAAQELGQQERPVGVTSWSLAPGTGSPDGQTAVVRLSADVRLPIVGGFLHSLGTGVSVTVESRARSQLR